MKPARRRDRALRERPTTWGHILFGDHLGAADLGLDPVDLKAGLHPARCRHFLRRLGSGEK